jgi:hypothetical protein
MHYGHHIHETIVVYDRCLAYMPSFLHVSLFFDVSRYSCQSFYFANMKVLGPIMYFLEIITSRADGALLSHNRTKISICTSHLDMISTL